MMLTDREWLRFVSFGLLVGAVLGALYEAALLAAGRPFLHAVVGALVGGAAIALLFHVVTRYLLDRAHAPADDAGVSDTETATDTTESTETDA